MRTRKIILIPIAYLMFVALVASISYYIGYDIQKKAVVKSSHGTSYYTLPIISINSILSNTGRGEVRLGVNLEVGANDMGRIEGYVPRIVERIYTFLRRVSVADLRDSFFVKMMRKSLLEEINMVTGTVRVLGLRFREFIVTQ